MQHVAQVVLKALVGHPDAVVVDERASGGRVDLTVHVHPHDVGRVIGHRGRTIQAIRSLVRAAGSRHGIEVGLDLDAPPVR